MMAPTDIIMSKTFVAKDRGGRLVLIRTLIELWILNGTGESRLRIGIEKKRKERSSQRDIMTTEGLNLAMQFAAFHAAAPRSTNAHWLSLSVSQC